MVRFSDPENGCHTPGPGTSEDLQPTKNFKFQWISALILTEETDGHFLACDFDWEKNTDILLYAVPLMSLGLTNGEGYTHIYNEIAA